MGVLRRAITGGSVVEFSPATREAGIRFPASANVLHATILVSFPINRTKTLYSIVFWSSLSFLSSWKMLVSTTAKGNFGWPKLWKISTDSHLVPFCSWKMLATILVSFPISKTEPMFHRILVLTKLCEFLKNVSFTLQQKETLADLNYGK